MEGFYYAPIFSCLWNRLPINMKNKDIAKGLTISSIALLEKI